MLDVRRLRLLCEVARLGTIAAAAQSLSFTASAVSQQLTTLEREVGVALLERGPRSVRLTQAGERLVEHGQRILALLGEAETDVRDAARAGRVRLGTFGTVSAAILPDALARFAAVRPDAEVIAEVLDPDDGLAALKAGRLDIAILWEYDFVPVEPGEGVERRLLLEEPMHVVLPKGHRLARRRAISLPDLAHEGWISSTPRSSCRPFTERACVDAGFRPAIAFEIDDYQARQQLVAAGVGVAFVPEMAAFPVHPGVVVRPVAFRAPGRRIHVAYLRDRETALMLALVDALAEAAAARVAPQPTRARARR